jgi:hypothetical protein
VAVFFATMVSKNRGIVMPQKAMQRFFPFFLPLLLIAPVYLWRLLVSGAPLPLGESGLVEYLDVVGVVAGIFLLMAIGLVLGERLAGKAKPLCWKRFWLLPCAVAALGMLILGLDAMYAAHTLRGGGAGERVTEEISLHDYAPFSPNSQTIKADFILISH